MEAVSHFIKTQPLASIGVAVIVVGLTVWKVRKGPTLVEGKIAMKPKDNSSDVVIFAFARWNYGPSPSTGCLKLETFCRLARIPYRYDMDASKSGPTGRWPYISHKGKYVCDSNTCMEYLSKEVSPAPGDASLTAKDKALGDMITRMLDDGVYFHMLRYRWIDNFTYLKSEFRFPGVPAVVKSVLMGQFRSGILATLNSQGCGDRSDSEYLGDLLRDVKALEAWMPVDGCFFANSKLPTSYDATLYAFLQNLAAFSPENDKSGGGSKKPKKAAEFVTFLNSSPRIQSYLRTVEREAFPDMKTMPAETKNGKKFETVEKILEQMKKQ